MYWRNGHLRQSLLVLTAFFLSLFICVMSAPITTIPHTPVNITPSSNLSVEQTLDLFHTSASKADGETYFALFAKDGYFIGTDAKERWSLEEFRNYAMPYFRKGQGWTYVPRERHVNYSPDKSVAWFDEILHNDRFGVTRCSGVAVFQRGDHAWRISQYHLTVPIPNDLMDEVVQLIRDDSANSTAQT